MERQTSPSNLRSAAAATAAPVGGRRCAPTRSLGSKDAHDKFYTKPQVAAACLSRLDLNRFSRVIEPSAGAGAFSDQLFASTHPNVLAFDLVPENATVTKQDWFEFDVAEPGGQTLVVGNPPFGRQSSLALRFIDHAFDAVGADTVAFVLPRGFLKESVQDRVFRSARLIDQLTLPAASFTLHGADYSLPAVFQVWERCDTPRPALAGSLTSRFTDFVSLARTPHFAVRRVGGRAGHAYTPTAQSSPQTNYFLRLHDKVVGKKAPKVGAVIELVNSLRFTEVGFGTGPNSLSKREFIRHFDAAFEREFVSA